MSAWMTCISGLMITSGQRALYSHASEQTSVYPVKMSGQSKKRSFEVESSSESTEKKCRVTVKTAEKWVRENNKEYNTTTWLKRNRDDVSPRLVLVPDTKEGLVTFIGFSHIFDYIIAYAYHIYDFRYTYFFYMVYISSYRAN